MTVHNKPSCKKDKQYKTYTETPTLVILEGAKRGKLTFFWNDNEKLLDQSCLSLTLEECKQSGDLFFFY